MSKFDGKLCPVCREKISDNDETAVCPVCGTPHHRDCYLKLNKCALEELHGTFTWAGRLPDEPEPPEEPAEEPAQTEESEETAAASEFGEFGEFGGSGVIRDERDEVERLNKLNDILVEKTKQIAAHDFSKIIHSELDFQLLGRLELMLGLQPGYQKDPLTAEPYLSMMYAMMDPDPGVDGVSQRELTFFTAFNIDRYLRAFMPFRFGVKKTGFNLLSGLIMPINQFFRRMDGFAIAILGFIAATEGLPLLLNAVGILPTYAMSGIVWICRALLVAAALLMCFFGDYIYYRHAVARIRKIRKQFKGKGETLEYYLELFTCGRPSLVRGVVGLLALLFLRVLFGIIGP